VILRTTVAEWQPVTRYQALLTDAHKRLRESCHARNDGASVGKADLKARVWRVEPLRINWNTWAGVGDFAAAAGYGYLWMPVVDFVLPDPRFVAELEFFVRF
jgi:hypothetical protein